MIFFDYVTPSVLYPAPAMICNIYGNLVFCSVLLVIPFLIDHYNWFSEVDSDISILIDHSGTFTKYISEHL